MTLGQDILQPMIPTTMTVHWPDLETQTLTLELEGLEMDMGKIKYQLPRSANGEFTVSVLLPVCTQDAMTWTGQLSDGKNTVYPALRMKR